MNAENIAKALKCCYPPEGANTCEGCPYDGIEDPTCTERNIEYHAGEIIESLLSQLEAAIAGQETLQKAFVESQRREREAVEDMKAIIRNVGSHKSACDICSKPCGYEGLQSDWCDHFRWRGQVED